jgi:hypothetical protein
VDVVEELVDVEDIAGDEGAVSGSNWPTPPGL